MSHKYPTPEHKTIRRPRRSEIIFLRFLILVAFVLVAQFVIWYLDEDHMGQPFLYWALTFALGYKLLHILYEWYHYASMAVPVRPEKTREWKVDMLTTYVPGEPKDMLIRTLKAMVGVRYPHTTYLCDEGNDPELKQICAELGVVHVYRGKVKTGAKAGNINYTLQNYAEGEIAVILDPDHIPVREFLDRALPYFEDPKIGFVQSIQGYYNQEESLVALGAAEQTYMFYGPMMMGMQRRGTVQAIGANCTFRRAALDSIGGHATGLCEDMHTSMRLHARGWTSVYLPELLTRGMTPASISAYYQQQLKWSRGSFELLFEVYPKLFAKFSRAQRIHYLLIPLYFFYGIIGLIDLGIPVFSLLTYQVPLFIDFEEFIMRIVPVLVGIFLVRHYVQRYVLDSHEAGFHFIGGILRVSTWWIYLLGFIFAVFRIKVPYIPTRKENELANEWKISLPNIVVVIASAFAVIYGLQRDFTPFTWIMAGFAMINISLLSFIVIISQQKTLTRTYQHFTRRAWSVFRLHWFQFRHRFVYTLLRNSLFALLLIIVTLSLSSLHNLGFFDRTHLSDFYPDGEKAIGMSLSSGTWEASGNLLHRSTFVFKIEEDSPELGSKIGKILAYAANENITPLIKLVMPIDAAETDTIRVQARVWAAAIRNFQKPVILLPIWENPDTTAAGPDPAVLYASLKKEIRGIGASNIALAWEEREEPSSSIPHFADLVVIPSGRLSAIMARMDKKKDLFTRPVLFVRVCDEDCEDKSWLGEPRAEFAVSRLGWVSENAFRISCAETDAWLQDQFLLSSFQEAEKKTGSLQAPLPIPSWDHNSVILPGKGEAGKFEWRVDGAPFYVKGIVYNPQHSWRDGKWPLTRRRLQNDFTMVKAMGANTISREKPTVYDKNILQVAGEMELKVIYGFSFDPEIDYLQDTQQVRRIRRKILQQIERFKDEPALLAWTIGTGTWEALAEHFHQPYLSEVRLAYAETIAAVAKEIKQTDPHHPVFMGLIGDWDFRGALDDMDKATAFVDAIALDAYYPEQLEHLRTTMEDWGGNLPYIINEFGPKVNWQTPVFGYDDHKRILEPTSYEKGRLYAKLWTDIEEQKGYNLGGLAYCWRDRFEGTATFSGITDLRGRLKPAYYSLKEIWTGEPQQFPLADLKLKHGTIFGNQSINHVYSAMSANNLDQTLTYDWYICREEYLERIYRLRVNHSNNLKSFKYKIINEYNENVARTLYRIGRAAEVRYYQENAEPMQRIYLHIYDEHDHVVTASFPIDPNQEYE